MISRPLTPADIELDGGSASYWQGRARDDAARPALPILAHPCGDCAVECGFYEPLAWGLAAQPPEVRAIVLARWFCHNATSRACAGATNVAGIFDFRRKAHAFFVQARQASNL